jgi:spermidine synthase
VSEFLSFMSRKARNGSRDETPWLFGAGSVRRFVDEDGRRKGRRPFIVETGAERHLLFSHDSVQSTMRLDDPDALTCEYTRRMMAFLLFAPEPREILMIGLGGGSLAKFCYRHLPGATITAVEIDADVIALRDEFLVPFDDARFRVVHDDGARYLAKSPALVDVILVDAFDHTGVSPDLATSDFYRLAASRLSREGVFVMNLSGEPSRYDVHLQRIYDAFGERTALVQVASGDNELLFAFKSEVDLNTHEVQMRAAELRQRLSLDFPRYAQLLRSALARR